MSIRKPTIREWSRPYTAFVTRPERMHRVQTVIFRTLPSTLARTCWRFGLNRRLVILWAWLTLLPTKGFLPQISHCLDIFYLLALLNRPEAFHTKWLNPSHSNWLIPKATLSWIGIWAFTLKKQMCKGFFLFIVPFFRLLHLRFVGWYRSRFGLSG